MLDKYEYKWNNLSNRNNLTVWISNFDNATTPELTKNGLK